MPLEIPNMPEYSHPGVAPIYSRKYSEAIVKTSDVSEDDLDITQ